MLTDSQRPGVARTHAAAAGPGGALTVRDSGLLQRRRQRPLLPPLERRLAGGVYVIAERPGGHRGRHRELPGPAARADTRLRNEEQSRLGGADTPLQAQVQAPGDVYLSGDAGGGARHGIDIRQEAPPAGRVQRVLHEHQLCAAQSGALHEVGRLGARSQLQGHRRCHSERHYRDRIRGALVQPHPTGDLAGGVSLPPAQGARS
mmetsp:Transcript_32558/g.71645  ORF Transcript_32558/g.71645 Transcript_32558/m.71645 type:complete len:204 (-) Transcript_32558:1412-2023(-)